MHTLSLHDPLPIFHHVETKHGLTLATIEYAFARASAKSEEIIEAGLAKGEDPIDLMLNDFRLYFFNDDFWVSLDITINASKDPELKGGIREKIGRASCRERVCQYV